MTEYQVKLVFHPNASSKQEALDMVIEKLRQIFNADTQTTHLYAEINELPDSFWIASGVPTLFGQASLYAYPWDHVPPKEVQALQERFAKKISTDQIPTLIDTPVPLSDVEE